MRFVDLSVGARFRFAKASNPKCAPYTKITEYALGGKRFNATLPKPGQNRTLGHWYIDPESEVVEEV